MGLTVHHLQRSQSERVVFLCEELSLPYNLILHQRAPIFAPPSLKSIHPLETAPIISDTDGDIVLAESGACFEYILTKYGKGRLVIKPEKGKEWTEFLFWYHFANGTLQPAITRNVSLKSGGVAEESPTFQYVTSKREHALDMLDDRLKDHKWLAGKEFTAADIMTLFSVSTMRLFMPLNLGPYPNILSWMSRIGGRQGYKNAMAKGDEGLEPVLGAEPPTPLV